jgi:predicted dehydrogenase
VGWGFGVTTCTFGFWLDKAASTFQCAAMNILLTASPVENKTGRKLTRRRFLGGTIAAAASAPMLSVTRSLAQQSAPGTVYERKIKLGVIGNGGRGSWIANLFKKHGGYEMFAVADYFQEVADQFGDKLGVDKARRFSTLSGYKRLLECGVEAVALETPPYFFPEHAKAAVDARLHVYMAKPVAVDVPGALQILAAANEAARKKRCFLVDYQMPTDPANNEVLRRLRTPEFSTISQVATVGIGGGFQDPPKGDTIENRLRGLIWVNDIALGCDYIGNYDIHAIDAAIWALGKRPKAASGSSRICRPDPHGDSRDVCSVVFEYDGGLVHNHLGMALNNLVQGELSCRIYGLRGNALINYWGKASFRSSENKYEAAVENLYEAGATRNIAAFYRDVTEDRFENGTPQRSVDGVLACILGREAARRNDRLNMEQLLKENKRLEVDLHGLKS